MNSPFFSLFHGARYILHVFYLVFVIHFYYYFLGGWRWGVRWLEIIVVQNLGAEYKEKGRVKWAVKM